MNLKINFFYLKLLFSLFFILLGIIFAYHLSLNNGFLTNWDTALYVTKNTHIKSLNWENIEWMFTTLYMVNWHPITWLSHALDYHWFGVNPWGHHLVSLVIHSLNSVLVFFLVFFLLALKDHQKQPFWPSFNENKRILAAGIAGLLFGIHPQHVESVVWIAERKDVLCLLFILLALISYFFYHQAETHKKRLYWYSISLFSFFLAIMSKPMAVTFPAILLLLDVYPLQRTPLTFSQRNIITPYKQLLVEKIPFFILTFFLIFITLWAQRNVMPSIESLGMLERFLNAFNSLIFYISKLLFPVGLSPFYTHFAVITSHDLIPMLISVAAVLLISILAIYLWRKKKYILLTSWAFYVITLSPVIGIIQVGSQAAADRYTYLPTIPLYLVIAIVITNLIYQQKNNKLLQLIIIFTFSIYVVTLVQLTQNYTQVWKDDISVWKHVTLNTPQHPFIHGKLADAYFKEGNYNQAIEHYHKAVSLAPHIGNLFKALPIAYIKTNRLSEALRLITHVIDNNFNIGHTKDYLYYLQGLTYAKQGRLNLAKIALKKSLEVNKMNNDAKKLLTKINSS